MKTWKLKHKRHIVAMMIGFDGMKLIETICSNFGSSTYMLSFIWNTGKKAANNNLHCCTSRCSCFLDCNSFKIETVEMIRLKMECMWLWHISVHMLTILYYKVFMMIIVIKCSKMYTVNVNKSNNNNRYIHKNHVQMIIRRDICHMYENYFDSLC